MSWFIVFTCVLSLEELDDFSDSGSDYEATLKTTKKRKQTILGPQVNSLVLLL